MSHDDLDNAFTPARIFRGCIIAGILARQGMAIGHALAIQFRPHGIDAEAASVQAAYAADAVNARGTLGRWEFDPNLTGGGHAVALRRIGSSTAAV